MPWIRSVVNHLYWSAQSCNGDGELLKEKWMSCVHHVAIVHAWNGERVVQCEHSIDEGNNIAWMEIDSPPHLAL